MRRALAVLAAGFLAVCVVLAGAVLRPQGKVVVLVVLDTVRSDAMLPSTSGPNENTPFISERGQQGLVFEHAYSTSSWTAPSTASIFTGRYPLEHGVTLGFRAQQRHAGRRSQAVTMMTLPTEELTLPQLFSEAGFETLGVANNINIGEEIGFDRGFDYFKKSKDATAKEMVAELLTHRNQWSRQPLFVYTHLNDAHHPYTPRRPWVRGDSELEKYRSEVRYLDEVLREFASDPLFADAVIMVVSDHGEAFGEHELRGHTFSLYREVNQVGMVLWGPGVPTDHVSTAVSLVDVLPTLMEVAEIEVAARSGQSLLQRAPSTRTVFSHRVSPHQEGELWSATDGEHKVVDLLVNSQHNYEAFDLILDRAEEHSVVEPTAWSSRLKDQLVAHQALSGGGSEPVVVPVDDELYEHLEALGYVDP